MNNQLLHTPEGVRDIYGSEYKKKLRIESLLHEKIEAFGYEDIQTPTFEFFDVFSKEVGTTASKELYKFFDKEGNTLVLRPDFTPSIARCAAKYFCDDDKPIRLTYSGSAFSNTSSLQGKLKETTQMGAELIGDDSVEADAEMIALVCECLFHSGLSDFQISIGNIEYFKGLCEAAGLDDSVEYTLRDYISGKNYFAAEEMLESCNIDKEHSQKLLAVTDLYGQVDILDKAEEMANNPRSKEAAKRLKELYKKLVGYGVEKYVFFDLGILSKYNYYTGIIFRAYTLGVGDCIVKGGRYDKLLAHFGKDAAAIGFVVLVDDLMSAMTRQGILIQEDNKPVVLEYSEEDYDEKLKEALRLRRINSSKVILTHK